MAGLGKNRDSFPALVERNIEVCVSSEGGFVHRAGDDPMDVSESAVVDVKSGLVAPAKPLLMLRGRLPIETGRVPEKLPCRACGC